MGNVPDSPGISLAWILHLNLKQIHVKSVLSEPL